MCFEILVNAIGGLGGLMEVRRLGTIVVTMKKDFIKVYINKSDFWKILSEIEKAVKTFSIPDKSFQKIVYYCVPLGYTLVKSF